MLEYLDCLKKVGISHGNVPNYRERSHVKGDNIEGYKCWALLLGYKWEQSHIMGMFP